MREIICDLRTIRPGRLKPLMGAIYVYPPSLEPVEGWKRRAKKGDISISGFVIERVRELESRLRGKKARKRQPNSKTPRGSLTNI